MYYISEKNLVNRVNRKLVKQDQVLRLFSPNSRWFPTYGRYGRYDMARKAMVPVDLIQEAQYLGLLRAGEVFVEN